MLNGACLSAESGVLTFRGGKGGLKRNAVRRSFAGAFLGEIDPEETPPTGFYDETIRARAGEILPQFQTGLKIMNEETQESWAVSEGNMDHGLLFILRFRKDLPDESEQKKLKMLIVVSWDFESADGTGMPSGDEENEMEDFENLLDDALVEKGTARLVTVFTGEGVREWQFYTDDAEFFMRKFNEAMEGRQVLPLEIEAFEDENWDAYKDYTGIGLTE